MNKTEKPIGVRRGHRSRLTPSFHPAAQVFSAWLIPVNRAAALALAEEVIDPAAAGKKELVLVQERQGLAARASAFPTAGNEEATPE